MKPFDFGLKLDISGAIAFAIIAVVSFNLSDDKSVALFPCWLCGLHCGMAMTALGKKDDAT